MKFFCCDQNRRNDVENHPVLNGIEYIEVVDNPTDAPDVRQTVLEVHFIKNITPGSLTKEQVIIEGGDRIKNILVTNIEIGHPDSPLFSPLAEDASKTLIVTVNTAGDFSTYTLRLVQDKDAVRLVPPVNYDPILSSVDFSFKINCPSDFDCKTKDPCIKPIPDHPEINYLAKDYASFRQVMLDRMAVLLPEWKERNPSDVGIMLVELLAYAGDYLSYKQDAIATEAYLGTARKRISLKRHVRLVDYPMHEGCNARTWVHLELKEGVNKLKLVRKLNADGKVVNRFITKTDHEFSKIFNSGSKEFTTALNDKVQVFEPLHDEELYFAHNTMYFYTWGDKQCALPKGSTGATLTGDFSKLKPGHVLIFQEVKGPQTGNAADADPTHRHAVRLTEIITDYDPLYPLSPLSPAQGTPVTLIKWNEDDALPFTLCISSKQGTSYYDNVSVAVGNNVLVDHGITVEDEKLSSLDPDTVQDSGLTLIVSKSVTCCESSSNTPLPPRYRPKLKRGPLTYAAPYNYENTRTSARDAMKWSLADTLPKLHLFKIETTGKEEWLPVRDLLSSGSSAKEFVVEMESNGIAHIRFGDNIHGLRPAVGNRFLTTYRKGNGTAGNIGRESIGHLVSDDPAINSSSIKSFTNPMAAVGGMEPETMEMVRQKAPVAFQKQERAVTADDYEEMTKRTSRSIQRAACTFRWTGSWHTAFLSLDRFGGEDVDQQFENETRKRLERYRMAGHDIEINGPRYVSLELKMIICVKPNYFASDVKKALLGIFTNRLMPGGGKGLFHPDNFSFGKPVYLSPLYTAAQSVDGVASVLIKTFKRQNDSNNDAIETGKLFLAPLEIARLDNDRNYPDHGVFNLVMKGGK